LLAFDVVDGKIAPPPPVPPIVPAADDSTNPSRTTGSPIASATGDTAFAGPGELLSRAWSRYVSRFGAIMVVNLLPLLVFFGLGVVIALMFAGAIAAGSLGSLSGSLEQMLGGAIGFTVVAFLAIIAMIYFAVLFQIAMLWVVQRETDTDLSIREAFGRASKQVWSFFFTSFLLQFAILGGFLFFFIPGIWATLALSFTLFITVFEKKSFFSAMTQSVGYVKDRFWDVLLRTLVLLVIAIGLQLFHLLGGIEGLEIVAVLLNLLTSIFFPAFAILYSYEMYRSLKQSKIHRGEDISPAGGKRIGFLSLLPIVVLILVIVFAAAFGSGLNDPGFVGLSGLESMSEPSFDSDYEFSDMSDFDQEL
jgi:hypothetical protein